MNLWHAIKHSFCYFFPQKSSAKRRSVNLFRGQPIEFPKTDAFGIFEAIKKSPFLNRNSIARPISEKASAEMRLTHKKIILERHATPRTLESDEKASLAKI